MPAGIERRPVFSAQDFSKMSVFGSLADVTAGRSVTNNLEGPNSGCRMANGPQEHARRY
jgi:hypothetical protein